MKKFGIRTEGIEIENLFKNYLLNNALNHQQSLWIKNND